MRLPWKDATPTIPTDEEVWIATNIILREAISETTLFIAVSADSRKRAIGKRAKTDSFILRNAIICKSEMPVG